MLEEVKSQRKINSRYRAEICYREAPIAWSSIELKVSRNMLVCEISRFKAKYTFRYKNVLTCIIEQIYPYVLCFFAISFLRIHGRTV